MATDVLSNKTSIFECVIYNLQLRPIQTEDDAYKNAKKCLHKQPIPNMYSRTFRGKENFPPYSIL